MKKFNLILRVLIAASSVCSTAKADQASFKACLVDQLADPSGTYQQCVNYFGRGSFYCSGTLQGLENPQTNQQCGGYYYSNYPVYVPTRNKQGQITFDGMTVVPPAASVGNADYCDIAGQSVPVYGSDGNISAVAFQLFTNLGNPDGCGFRINATSEGIGIICLADGFGTVTCPY